MSGSTASAVASAKKNGSFKKMGGEGEEIQPEEKTGKSRRACLHKQLHKTKFCSYYLKGACHYGNDCVFAHTCAELQATPDLRKTRTCKAFAEGKCTDVNCSFAHGEHQLISTGLFHKMSLCKWNEKGRCRNGDQCRFAHGVGELRDGKTALASPTAATQAKGDVGTSWTASEPQPMKGDVGTSWVSSEPQPMKVPPPAVGLTLGPAAAALAAVASIGLPAMPKVPTWPDSSLAAISALDAWQPQGAVHTPGLRMQNSINPLMEMEQLRMSIVALSSRCAQMQRQLMPLARASPPGFEGNTLGHVEFGADKISVAQLTKMQMMNGRGPSTKPSFGMTAAEASMFSSGFCKDALGG